MIRKVGLDLLQNTYERQRKNNWIYKHINAIGNNFLCSYPL